MYLYFKACLFLYCKTVVVSCNSDETASCFLHRREYGLEKFVPMSLLETMKRKELIKLLNQLIKQNQALGGPGQKQLSATQAKFHYLKIVSDLPSYGAKSFATCTKVRKPRYIFILSSTFFFFACIL